MKEIAAYLIVLILLFLVGSFLFINSCNPQKKITNNAVSTSDSAFNNLSDTGTVHEYANIIIDSTLIFEDVPVNTYFKGAYNVVDSLIDNNIFYSLQNCDGKFYLWLKTNSDTLLIKIK